MDKNNYSPSQIIFTKKKNENNTWYNYKFKIKFSVRLEFKIKTEFSVSKKPSAKVPT